MSICQGSRYDKALRSSGGRKNNIDCCAGLEAGLETTVDQSLMRGLATAGPRCSPRSFLCQRTGVGKTGLKKRAANSPNRPRPQCCTAIGMVDASCCGGRSRADRLTNRPDEANQLSCNSGYAVATAPSRRSSRWRGQALLTALHLLADARRTTISPCALD